jgi:hypothetical protein
MTLSSLSNNPMTAALPPRLVGKQASRVGTPTGRYTFFALNTTAYSTGHTHAPDAERAHGSTDVLAENAYGDIASE